MINYIEEIFKKYEPKIYGQRMEAAVLLPLIKVKEEWHILYEVRSAVVSQAGDSSFPGGGVEAEETYKETAIRETMEELNIKEENIRILGEMDYIVHQQMIIYCFVGELINLAVEDIQPNIEVEKVYTIPLSYFLENKPAYFSVKFDPVIEEQFLEKQRDDKQPYKLRKVDEKVPYYAIEKHLLWGFTANLTERFIEIIENSSSKESDE